MNSQATLLNAYGPAQAQTAQSRDAAKVRQAAEDFEAFFVAQAFEEMYAGIETDPLFGGGQGENVFRTFLLQEYGKQVARAGGIGIADMVQRQLLQIQEVGK